MANEPKKSTEPVEPKKSGSAGMWDMISRKNYADIKAVLVLFILSAIFKEQEVLKQASLMAFWDVVIFRLFFNKTISGKK